MQKFRTKTDYWHKNALHPPGSVIEMPLAAAKYLKHALELIDDDTPEKPNPVQNRSKRSRRYTPQAQVVEVIEASPEPAEVNINAEIVADE